MAKCYVDGFVLNVPKKKIADYKKLATEACEVWMKFGALSYTEAVLDDEKEAKKNKSLLFGKIAGTKPSELVLYSFIMYKSRVHRDSVNKKVMAYFKKKYGETDCSKDMPFDVKRMAFAGFESIVHQR